MPDWFLPKIVAPILLGLAAAGLLVNRFWPDLRLAAKGRRAQGLVIGTVELDTDMAGHPARCARVRFVDHQGEAHVFLSQQRTAPAYRVGETYRSGDKVTVQYDAASPWFAKIA